MKSMMVPEARSIPIITGDMFNALSDAKRKHDDQWPLSPAVALVSHAF
jgi:hypothetical protein